ncbi:MAG: sugar phosphate isomerase/epimerase [Firmicutes bacterium]|nr:sugar phosphate isomerase/epimerase [Bacillota bacterium]
MARFELSAFSDELSADFERQLEGMAERNIGLIEIRGVFGKNISEVSESEAHEIKKMLDLYGIGLSAIGSPLGKINIQGDMAGHLELTKRITNIANILGCSKIRGFSFYGTNDDDKDTVVEAVGKMTDITYAGGVLFCHENEKGIYGDTPEKCLLLKHELGDFLGVVFDPANFIQCGRVPYPVAYEMLAEDITYVHIKDSDAYGTVMPAGEGIGRIPEMLTALNVRNEDIILTLEPHLRVFDGLDALEGGEKSLIGGGYRTSEEAFDAAVNAIRGIMKNVGVAEIR